MIVGGALRLHPKISNVNDVNSQLGNNIFMLTNKGIECDLLFNWDSEKTIESDLRDIVEVIRSVKKGIKISGELLAFVGTAGNYRTKRITVRGNTPQINDCKFRFLQVYESSGKRKH